MSFALSENLRAQRYHRVFDSFFAFVYCFILNAQCLVFGLLQMPRISITLYLSAYSVLSYRYKLNSTYLV